MKLQIKQLSLSTHRRRGGERSELPKHGVPAAVLVNYRRRSKSETERAEQIRELPKFESEHEIQGFSSKFKR